MKKKELFGKINTLVDALNSMQRQLNAARVQNSELKEEIERQKAVIAELSAAKTEPAPPASAADAPAAGFTVNTQLDGTDGTPDSAPQPAAGIGDCPEELFPVILADEVIEYGSVAIGKIVQESVRYANIISLSDSENKKELLNLIMGKGEIAKSEIFSITEGDAPDEAKKQLIDSMVNETVDYFKSVAGQI